MISEKIIVYVIMPIMCSLGVFLTSRYMGREVEKVNSWKERLKLWFVCGVAIFFNLVLIYILLIVQELYLV